jgi:CRP/FNR family transcriptional regulator, dissimilatory nitrate respiration regulator
MKAPFKSIFKSLRQTADFQDKQKIQLLRHFPLFESYSDRHIQVLSQTCFVRQFNVEEFIYHEGSPAVAMYFVLDGSVGLYQKRRSQQTDRIHLVQSGAFFGDASLFTARERQHSAKALEKTQLLVLFKSDYDQLAASQPQLAMKILAVVAAKLYRDLTVFQTEFHELSQKVAQDQLLK